MNIKLNIKPFLLLVVFIGVGNMTVFGQDYIETENLEAVIIYGSSGFMTYAEYNNWVSNLGTGGNYNDYDTNTDLYYFYDYNSGSGSSTNTTDSSSNSVSNLEIPAEFKNGNLGLKNPNITIPCKRETVAGVNTLVLAPIKQLVVNMPTAELNGMISLYNSTATNPVTVEGVVSGITSNLEAGTIVITSIGEFEVWLQQYVITRAVELSGNDDVRFEGCDGSCYCDACEKQWYLDNDGDGYHVSSQLSITKPTNGKWKSSTLGEDCDDTNPKVHEQMKSLGSFSIYTDSRQPGLADPNDGGVIARDYEEGDLDEAEFISLIESNINFGSGPRAKQAMKRYVKRIKTLMSSSDDILFENMENAAWYSLRFQQTPLLGNGLGNYTFEENYQANLNMIARFRQDSKGVVDASGITKSIISQDPNLQVFFDDLKDKVENEIDNIDNVNELNTIQLSAVTAPIFNTGANRFNWNSSWTVNVKFNNVTLNCAQLFGTLVVDVYDQFGLDNADMFTAPSAAKARALDGIWAWFILQRVVRPNRINYAPFINHYNESQTISITIN